jgi:hypothetical protein
MSPQRERSRSTSSPDAARSENGVRHRVRTPCLARAMGKSLFSIHALCSRSLRSVRTGLWNDLCGFDANALDKTRCLTPSLDLAPIALAEPAATSAAASSAAAREAASASART